MVSVARAPRAFSDASSTNTMRCGGVDASSSTNVFTNPSLLNWRRMYVLRSVS